MAQATDVETMSDNELLIISERPGSQPIMDIAAFLASLPKFTDEEVQALEEAIAVDRAERRAHLETDH